MGKRTTTAVVCAECKHRATLNGPKSTWLCSCAATNPDCDCDHLNVVD